MKIRIKSNSIRFRLNKSDVAILLEKGYLEDGVDFGTRKLVYAIWVDGDEQLSVSFNDSIISLLMPKYMIKELADTDKVGFSNDEGPVYLLVEKDFTCLDNVAEDQSDNYPNPLAEKTT